MIRSCATLLTAVAALGCGDNLKRGEPDARVDAVPDVAIDAAPPGPVSIRIGDDALESLSSVAIAADGTVYAVGLRGGDALAVKLDANNQLLASHTFGVAEVDSLQGVTLDAAGTGVVAVGFSGADNQALAVHLAADLSIAHATSFGGSQRQGDTTNEGGQHFNAVARTSHGFVAVGRTYPTTTASDGSYWHVGLDAQLAPRWQHTFGNPHGRVFTSAAAASGARAYAGGFAYSVANQTRSGFRLTAIDDAATDRTIAWDRQLEPTQSSGADLDAILGLSITANGQIWAAGYQDDFSAFRGLVVRYDADGTPLVANRLIDLGGSVIPRTVVATSDGGCVIAGDTGNRGVIVKLAADGSIEWQRKVGVGIPSNGLARIFDAKLAPDGSLVLVGRYEEDAWVIRLPNLDEPVGFGEMPMFEEAPVTPLVATTLTDTHKFAANAAAWVATTTNTAALPVAEAP